MKRVAVLQSNYIPWKGYFDIINDSDLFIFYDDVQYTKNDWRNRNIIKTKNGVEWITVPVGQRIDRTIKEVKIDNNLWQIKHWKTISLSYSKAPFFNNYKVFFEYVYLEKKWVSLSEMNQFMIKEISEKFLGIKTKFEDSGKYELKGASLERLIDILKKSEADYYTSGPAAKAYIDEERFKKEKIILNYKDYSKYPVYNQIHGEFTHNVSILDLLFNTGTDAAWYIWGFREGSEKQ